MFLDNNQFLLARRPVWGATQQTQHGSPTEHRHNIVTIYIVTYSNEPDSNSVLIILVIVNALQSISVVCYSMNVF